MYKTHNPSWPLLDQRLADLESGGERPIVSIQDIASFMKARSDKKFTFPYVCFLLREQQPLKYASDSSKVGLGASTLDIIQDLAVTRRGLVGKTKVVERQGLQFFKVLW